MASFAFVLLLVLMYYGYDGRVDSGSVKVTKFNTTGFKLDWKSVPQACNRKDAQMRNPVIYTTMKSMKNEERFVTLAVIELELDGQPGSRKNRYPLATYVVYSSPMGRRVSQTKNDETLGYLYGSIRYGKISASIVEVGVFYEAKRRLQEGSTFVEVCGKITYSISNNMKVSASKSEDADCDYLKKNYLPSSNKYGPK